MAQDIYLNTNQILSYLYDFETKLPRPRKDFYVSSFKTTPLTIDDLNYEVNQMMDFIGFRGFRANCELADLPSDTGGQVLLDGRKTGKLNIKIREGLVYDVEAASATLAHELCHKYLEYYGIYFPHLETMNEIYTDLCTMYVGFGKVILCGYNTPHWKSGYLKLPVYRTTNSLVRMVIWDEKDSCKPDEEEPLLAEALGKWTSGPDKRQILRREYFDAFRNIADYQRNIESARQLLSMLMEEPLELARKNESILYNSDWFDDNNGIKKRIACFTGLYEGVYVKDRMDEASVTTVNSYLQHLIVQLADLVGKDKLVLDRISPAYFECPYCKHRSEASKIADSQTIVKCSKCKKSFAVNCEKLELAPARANYESFKDGIVAPVRESLLVSQRTMYLRGVKVGKAENELQAKIEKLPRWLKWLIGKRLS